MRCRTRSPREPAPGSVRALVGAVALCLFTAAAGQGAVADLWPVQARATSGAADLAQRTAALEAAAPTLPPGLAPALRYEETFWQILGGAPQADWSARIRDFVNAPGTDPVTAAVRDAARGWLARLQMQAIGSVLDDYYARNVRFPAALSEVERNLPKDLRADPWGEPWVYRLHAPQGFARETTQRYQLGPTRFPNLGTLREATVERRPFTPPAWRIVLRPVGASPALEFHAGAALLGLIQAGGKIDVYTLAYVGDHWALLAGPDQLFTVSF